MVEQTKNKHFLFVIPEELQGITLTKTNLKKQKFVNKQRF